MLDPLRVNSLSKADTKKKLQLISTINKVLYKKSRTFGDMCLIKVALKIDNSP